MFPILINLFLLDLALETFSPPLLLDVNNIIIDKKNEINNIINRQLKYLLSMEYFMKIQSIPWRNVNPNAKNPPINLKNLFDPNFEYSYFSNIILLVILNKRSGQINSSLVILKN